MIQRVIADVQNDDGGLIALRAALSGKALNITDVTCLQRYLIQLPTPYPVGEAAETVLYQ